MSRPISVKNLVRERNALRKRIEHLREVLDMIGEGDLNFADAKVDALDALGRDDALAAEAAKDERTEPLRGPLPGMIAGYWFGASEPIPDSPPVYAPTSALLAARSASLPSLVLVERAGEWFPLSEAGALTYAFTRFEDARFVAWGPQGRLVQRSKFVRVNAGNVGTLYGRDAKARCYNGRRLVAVEAIVEQPAAPAFEPVYAPPEPPLATPPPADPVHVGLGTPWLSIRAAADLLSMTESALRRALERRAERRGDTTVADLDGIRGRKLGSRWRVSLAALDAQLENAPARED